MSNTSNWVESGPVTIQTVRKNYHFGGQLVATKRGSEVYFIHGDHPSASLRTSLGSTSLTTDISGTVVAETRYLPCGEERWTAGGAQPTDFTFTGQRTERGFGLMDYGARYYALRLGRFVSSDTIVPEPRNPQVLNRYAYVLGNPLRYTDPSGRKKDPRTGSAGMDWEKLHHLFDRAQEAAGDAYRGTLREYQSARAVEYYNLSQGDYVNAQVTRDHIEGSLRPRLDINNYSGPAVRAKTLWQSAAADVGEATFGGFSSFRSKLDPETI